ncbi:MAG TPA: VIT1/CCC1 transporter family protein [Candidatus Limnocylindrales bacterium]|nr:VIT1/CCC1 transporter family protein [Candidatus Limnocylindrales bacterium]
MAPIDVEQSLDNLKLERDAIVLYDALAGIERDDRRAAAFRRIASNERRHAAIWASKLTELGATVPAAGGPRARVRFIILAARLFGTAAVAELVKALEGDEEDAYDAQGGSPEVAAIAADEREHAAIWERLKGGAESASIGLGRDVDGGRRDGVAIAARARDAAEIGQHEHWHRSGRSGTLRAVIFGVSDGLVSNLSLVMGVAGAALGNPSFILLAGVAGLLAGAFSMAAGEYISMQSQRELFERQIALERAEMEAMPEEEEAELAASYRAKGFAPDEAARIAHRIFQDPENALDMLVREELGLDPDQLGSAWGAAGGSFVAFALGAVVPVIPYLFGGGTTALLASLALSLAALFAVGAAVSLLTGRGLLFSGVRQLGIGLAAALVTYLIGSLIGVTAAG